MWCCSPFPRSAERWRLSFCLKILLWWDCRAGILSPIEAGVKPQHLLAEDLLLLKEGNCLRDHALAALRGLADRRLAEFEATSLPTLVQMVDNGIGTTLLPTLAIDAGLLRGTQLVTRPLLSDELARKISLIWRRGTGRREEFRLLAKELSARAKMATKPEAR